MERGYVKKRLSDNYIAGEPLPYEGVIGGLA